jgi:uncharacterized repeat protein (TIGR01451 family)
MRRVILASLLADLLILAGLITLQGVFITLALPILLYLLAGLIFAPEKIELRAARTLTLERVAPGDPLDITLTIANAGGALDEVLLEDLLPPGLEVIEGSTRRLMSLKAKETITWTYTVRAPRGYYPFNDLKVTARDRLGLIVREQIVEAPGRFFVIPIAARVRRIAIRPRQTRVYSGMIPARQGGAGVEIFGVREYQPGDPLHWINWRATARHPQAVFSNEYEQERVGDVGIILDGRRRVNEFGPGRSIFEYSVQAAASLADSFLNSGNRVGLLLYGKIVNWTTPGYGKLQREKIMHALSLAHAGETHFPELIIPRRLFPAYSQMVLISPLENSDLGMLVKMRSAGYQVIVISPDPVSYESAGLPQTKSTELAARIVRLERQMLLRRAQHAGVQIINWDVAQPFEQIVSAWLSRPPAWLRAINVGDRP